MFGTAVLLGIPAHYTDRGARLSYPVSVLLLDSVLLTLTLIANYLGSQAECLFINKTSSGKLKSSIKWAVPFTKLTGPGNYPLAEMAAHYLVILQLLTSQRYHIKAHSFSKEEQANTD